MLQDDTIRISFLIFSTQQFLNIEFFHFSVCELCPGILRENCSTVYRSTLIMPLYVCGSYLEHKNAECKVCVLFLVGAKMRTKRVLKADDRRWGQALACLWQYSLLSPCCPCYRVTARNLPLRAPRSFWNELLRAHLVQQSTSCVKPAFAGLHVWSPTCVSQLCSNLLNRMLKYYQY